VLESTNLNYFTPELTAEFYGLKGFFFAKCGNADDAQKSFSASVQLDDSKLRAWSQWGAFLEQVFLNNRSTSGQQTSSIEQAGNSAIASFMAACRNQSEIRTRKFLAKVIWLLSYDDSQLDLAGTVDKYNVGIPPIQWLTWIPQLLTYLVCVNGAKLLSLLSTVARVHPQAVYFPIRTMYLTLKIEQRERYKHNSSHSGSSASGEGETEVKKENIQSSQSGGNPIRATPSMWRCSRIMHMQRDTHPTLLSSLEGIVDQMVWFRESWNEEVLRQLCQALAKCYAIAFENKNNISEAVITSHVQNFIRKLVATFGIGIEGNTSQITHQQSSSAASESLAMRLQLTNHDPVFQHMKLQFTTDFDFSSVGSTKLQPTILKLKKWIRVLQAKTKVMPKSFLIEEKCRFLSKFASTTAEVDLPGEYLTPKMQGYYTRIARFMPRVHVVQKHDTAARRLCIRGSNGKIYPYLVMNDACLIESRREERVLQLLRLFNPSLEKRKETGRRQLLFTVQRVVAFSPQMRMVQDNTSSLSLLDVYKMRCLRNKWEFDAPLKYYYERLQELQDRGEDITDEKYKNIMKHIQIYKLPRNMLVHWARTTFVDATDYWTFRKSFTLHLALLNFAQSCLHFTQLRPEMLHISQDSGHLHSAYYRFSIDNMTGELESNDPVQLRLTPNICEFIQPGINMFKSAMVAAARCFMHPNFHMDSLLRVVLRDEMIGWFKNKDDNVANQQIPNIENEKLIKLVNGAVQAITTKIRQVGSMEESRIDRIVEISSDVSNISKMDPTWYPWI